MSVYIDEEEHFEVIEHYYNLEKYDKVIELIHEELPSHSENGWLWFILAHSYLLLQQYEEAEQHFLEAIRLDYDPAEYRLVYQDTGRWQDAEEAFLESITMDPIDQEFM